MKQVNYMKMLRYEHFINVMARMNTLCQLLALFFIIAIKLFIYFHWERMCFSLSLPSHLYQQNNFLSNN